MNKSMILGIVRHGLTTAGGVLVSKGVIDDAGWSEAVGAIVTLIGVGWSIWEKHQAKAAPSGAATAPGGAAGS